MERRNSEQPLPTKSIVDESDYLGDAPVMAVPWLGVAEGRRSLKALDWSVGPNGAIISKGILQWWDRLLMQKQEVTDRRALLGKETD